MAYENFTIVYEADAIEETVKKIEYCTNSRGAGLFVWRLGTAFQAKGTADFTYRNRKQLLRFLDKEYGSFYRRYFLSVSGARKYVETNK